MLRRAISSTGSPERTILSRLCAIFTFLFVLFLFCVLVAYLLLDIPNSWIAPAFVITLGLVIVFLLLFIYILSSCVQLSPNAPSHSGVRNSSRSRDSARRTSSPSSVYLNGIHNNATRTPSRTPPNAPPSSLLNVQTNVSLIPRRHHHRHRHRSESPPSYANRDYFGPPDYLPAYYNTSCDPPPYPGTV